MDKIKKIFNVNKLGANLIATVGLAIAIQSSHIFCVYIFHQPKMPEEINRLRKF